MDLAGVNKCRRVKYTRGLNTGSHEDNCYVRSCLSLPLVHKILVQQVNLTQRPYFTEMLKDGVTIPGMWEGKGRRRGALSKLHCGRQK